MSNHDELRSNGAILSKHVTKATIDEKAFQEAIGQTMEQGYKGGVREYMRCFIEAYESAKAAAPADEQIGGSPDEEIWTLGQLATKITRMLGGDIYSQQVGDVAEVLRPFVCGPESDAAPGDTAVSMATHATEAKATAPSTSDDALRERFKIIARDYAERFGMPHKAGEGFRLCHEDDMTKGILAAIYEALSAQPPAQQPAGVDDLKLIELMCLAAWGTESKTKRMIQISIMEDALDAIRGYLHPQPAQQASSPLAFLDEAETVESVAKSLPEVMRTGDGQVWILPAVTRQELARAAIQAIKRIAEGKA